MLHHLTEEGRRQGIGEIARVLKPAAKFLAIDIGGRTEATHHRLFLRLRRHAHFDLEELTPVLEAAALQIVERGPVTTPGVVGLPNLRFILAVAPSS